MTWMKVTLRARQRRGPPQGGTLRECASLTGRDGQKKEAAGGDEGYGEITLIPPIQVLARLAAEVGPSMTSKEASHFRPTVGGRPPTKNFVKGD